MKILNKEAQKEALNLARKTLESRLCGQTLPQYQPSSPLLKKPFGAFVTLKKNGELRGCIGAFETHKPLYQVIEEMAIAAATEDPRFPKVLAEELKDIKIEISIMTQQKKINDWRKIKLGKHGVVIEAGNRHGVFLPQVALETGWTLEEFLSELCLRKAGLPPDAYKYSNVNLYVFEAQIIEEE